MKSLDWMGDALCAQTGPDIFFPEGPGQNLHKAKAICAECPVRTQCGEHAQHLEGDLCHPKRHGAWAGQSPKERANTGGPSRKATRDEAVIRLTDRGMTLAEIAEQLDITTRTVLRVRAATSKETAV